jgi:hypothetical protein
MGEILPRQSRRESRFGAAAAARTGIVCGGIRACANEAWPPSHQSVKRRVAIASSIDDLPRPINLFFMLLFKPILDGAL